MFTNIGGKIKGLAKFFCILGMIASFAAGISVVMIVPGIGVYAADTGAYFVVGILIFIVGSLLSWIGSFFTYGFGELVENSAKIAEKMEK